MASGTSSGLDYIDIIVMGWILVGDSRIHIPRHFILKIYIELHFIRKKVTLFSLVYINSVR